jgi:UDP-glucose 4-epimerase
MRKKILITGAAGFLGQLAIEYFSKSHDLILTDKKDLNQKNFYKLDITEFNQIDNLLLKEKPSIILHYASDIFDNYDKNEIFKNNIYGTFNLINASYKNDVKQIIFTSTFSIYEKDYPNLISESEPISCNNLYGISKAETERILLSSEKKLNVVIFRCPVIVDRTRAHRLGILFEFLKGGNTLWIIGDGKNKIQLLSAYDLFKVTEQGFNITGKKIYNIGADKVENLKDTFQYLINKTNSKSKIKYFNKTIGIFILKLLSKFNLIDFTDYHNKLLVSNVVMSIDKIKRELNFSPDKGSAELLHQAYDHYINSNEENKTGSAKKPRLGFFKFIKFFTKN